MGFFSVSEGKKAQNVECFCARSSGINKWLCSMWCQLLPRGSHTGHSFIQNKNTSLLELYYFIKLQTKLLEMGRWRIRIYSAQGLKSRSLSDFIYTQQHTYFSDTDKLLFAFLRHDEWLPTVSWWPHRETGYLNTNHRDNWNRHLSRNSSNWLCLGCVRPCLL